MKYHRMSLTGEELGFLESMRFGREEIAMIFGVPAPLLTPENATLANAEAYDQQFWNNTIVPLNVGIADILTQALVPEFTNRPHDLMLEHDYSQVPAMQPSLSLQAEVAERYIRSGFTPDGVNRVLDLGFEDHEIRHAPDEHSTIDGHVLPASGNLPPEERSVKAAAAEELKRLWKAADTTRTAWEEETAKRTSALFQREGTSVATAYLQNPTPEAARAAIEAHATNWRALLTALHTEVTRHYAETERDRLTSNRKAQPGSLESIADWAREHAARQVTGITRTTIDRIARVISDGLTPNEDGHHLTTDQIANRIADTYDSWVFTGPGPNLTIDQRAMMIARTEIGTAMNTGHTLGAQAAADELDLEMVKGWAASVDDRTRDTHLALHGETVPLNQAFSNGLQHPGDPDGPAEEIINCRCTVFHRVA